MTALPLVPPLVVLAVLAGSLVLLVGLVLAGGDGERRLRKRIETVRDRVATTGVGGGQGTGVSELRRREHVSRFGRLSGQVMRFVPRPEILRRELGKAGIGLALPDFVLLCGAFGTAVLVLMLLTGTPFALALPSALAAATGGPYMFVRMRVQHRAAKFLALMPEAIDLIVRALKSGLPISEAISIIGSEVQDPVGEVFREIADNIRIGMTVEEALWAATAKIDIPEFRFFVVTIAIQQETGGNLGAILQNLSTMIRRRQQMKLKIKAMSSEARASAMIIGSLPFIMAFVIYLMNPDYMLVLAVDPRGQMLAGLGLASMGLGVAVIAKMVRFEV